VDIELNISQDSAYVENILSFAPNRKRLIGCHNFYPQRYTALDYNFFVQCSKRYRALGLRTAAFINSPSATHGPHIFSDGLCTLEMHRDKSLLTQAKHYVAMNEWVDDIIIANAFASDAELESLAALPQEQLYLDVELMPHTSPLELEVLLNNQHFNRGDINSYSHRSTQVRVKYKEGDFPAHDTIPTLQRGDVTLGNNNFGQYKGELGLVKAAMPNNGAYKNVVARVVQEELFLLDYIKPNTKWRFRVKN
jgi:hypothetical protein